MAINDGYALFQGGYYRTSDMSGPYSIAEDGTATLIGAGGGGGGSSGGLTNAQLRAQAVEVHPGFKSGGNLVVSTNANGTGFVVFSSQACAQVTVVNDTDVTLEVQQGGAGAACPVLAQSSFTFFGVSNANQLGVRRKDKGADVLEVCARWES